MISNNKNDGITEIKTIVTNDIYNVSSFQNGNLDFIVDVGANIGVFSVMMRMRHPKAKIVAVEPCLETMYYLKKNTNMLNIDLMSYALGDGNKVSFFNVDGNLLRSVFVSNESNKEDTYQVESLKLGDIFDKQQLDISQNYLLKFDCEGAEQFLIGDPVAENIIKNSLQTSLEIHFKSEKTPYDFWLDFISYNDWIYEKFSESHSINYYKSSKSGGYGHYCLRSKHPNIADKKKPSDRYSSKRAYHPRYYKALNENTREYSEIVAKDLIERYKIESIVDFGCGVGFYVETAFKLGIKALGYEKYLSNSSDFMNKEILQFINEGDVTLPIICGKFDCAISVEVGEHIPENSSDRLVENMCNASDRLIIFTAGHIGQKGKGHINCQKRKFWIEKFEQRGWNYLDKEVEKTRKIWSKLKCAKEMPYLIENIMIFYKNGSEEPFSQLPS